MFANYPIRRRRGGPTRKTRDWGSAGGEGDEPREPEGGRSGAGFKAAVPARPLGLH